MFALCTMYVCRTVCLPPCLLFHNLPMQPKPSASKPQPSAALTLATATQV